jgi:hypothetical protein
VKAFGRISWLESQARGSVSSTDIKTRTLLNGLLGLKTSFGVPRCSSWQCLRSGSDFHARDLLSTVDTNHIERVKWKKAKSCRAWTSRSLEHWPIVQTCQLPEARFATVDLDRNGVTRLLADEFIMLDTENLERLMHPLLQATAERIELLGTPARHRKSHSLLHYQITIGKNLVIGKNWFSEYRMQKRLRQPLGLI